MEFVKPLWLWGLLTVIIPVVIHFWYQKKGTTIWWAANQWLAEKSALKHRGLKVDEIPLMLLRCLLLIVLVLLLSQPIIVFWSGQSAQKKIHLVDNNPEVLESFRFELETALERGEEVFLTGPEVSRMSAFKAGSGDPDAALFLQKNIADLAAENTRLDIYLDAKGAIALQSRIYVPVDYVLHTEHIKSKHNNVRYLNIGNGKGMYLRESDAVLRTEDVKSILQEYPKAQAVHNDHIRLAINVGNKAAYHAIIAAWGALKEVYQLSWTLDSARNSSGADFDVVISDKQPENPAQYVLYIVTSKQVTGAKSNVIFTGESLSPESSEMVRSGRLPEWFLAQLLTHYSLDQRRPMLSDADIRSKFFRVEDIMIDADAPFQRWLVVFFILLLLLERAIVYRKEVRNARI